MLGRIIILSVIVATTLLVVLLFGTEPATIGPVGMLIIFILMYISALGVVTFLLYGGSRILSKIASSFTVKKPMNAMSFRRAYYFASVLALAPVMIIGLQSVGGVGVYELLLIGLFELIACIYIAKRVN
jgi:hypothetical protein